MDEGVGMLEVCARIFADAPLGSVSIAIGVETVPGSAGIVCRDATYITEY